MNVSKHLKTVERLLSENANVLLTAAGVAGTVTTAILTGRATFKAAELIEESETKMIADDNLPIRDTLLSTKEKVKMVWPLYLPAAGVGTGTIAAIVMANRISSKRAAALAAAYGISEKAFQEYKEKVVEKLGEKKERDMKDEIAQDRVSNNPLTPQVVIAGTGEVLCYDSLTGRYFMSTIETIKRAENRVNYDIIHHMYASLSSFYEEIGLPSTSNSDELGWNTDHYLDVTYSTTLAADGRPCIVIDFKLAPITNYARLY